MFWPLYKTDPMLFSTINTPCFLRGNSYPVIIVDLPWLFSYYWVLFHILHELHWLVLYIMQKEPLHEFYRIGAVTNTPQIRLRLYRLSIFNGEMAGRPVLWHCHFLSAWIIVSGAVHYSAGAYFYRTCAANNTVWTKLRLYGLSIFNCSIPENQTMKLSYSDE